jgi:hypothetical protein
MLRRPGKARLPTTFSFHRGSDIEAVESCQASGVALTLRRHICGGSAEVPSTGYGRRAIESKPALPKT